MIETGTSRYVSCADTAKLVRAALKEAFPGQKFSVRSDTYSGGASINVAWIDGPLTRAVEAVAKAYEGADFDSMTDSKLYASHYLRPDGRALVARMPARFGAEPTDNTDLAPVLPADAERVRFAADFIFCTRTLSDARGWAAEAETFVRGHCVIDGTAGNERFGNHYLDDMVRAMALLHLAGETWDVAYRRYAHPYDAE